MTSLTSTAPVATGLHFELQDILRSLSDRIRAESSGSVADVRKRARLAEVGTLRSLCALCRRFLVGMDIGSLEKTDCRNFLSLGQIRDILDSALINARELKALREEADATLEGLTKNPATARLDPRCQAILSQLAKQEADAFELVQQQEKFDAKAATQALKTCVADITGVLLDALHAAREAPSDDSCRQLGQEAFEKIERAAGAWSSWFVDAERQSSRRPMPELSLAPELSASMAADAHLHSLVVSLRHAMKLRRRHARMASALQRLQAAVGACDAITALAGSVAEP